MPTLPRRVSRRPLAFAVPSYTLDEAIAMLQQFQARPGDFVAIAWVIDEMLKRLAHGGAPAGQAGGHADLTAHVASQNGHGVSELPHGRQGTPAKPRTPHKCGNKTREVTR